MSGVYKGRVEEEEQEPLGCEDERAYSAHSTQPKGQILRAHRVSLSPPWVGTVYDGGCCIYVARDSVTHSGHLLTALNTRCCSSSCSAPILSPLSASWHTNTSWPLVSSEICGPGSNGAGVNPAPSLPH